MSERIYVKLSLIVCACTSCAGKPFAKKLKALEFSDENGGHRITPFKHSGAWNTVQTWECSFEPEDLSAYAYQVTEGGKLQRFQ